MNKKEFNKRIKEISKTKDDNLRNELLVELLMEEDNSHPMDTSLKLITTQFPKEHHEALGLPGIFDKITTTEVISGYKKRGQMDFAYFVLPDGKITQYSMIDQEFQSKLPDYNKKGAILNYKLGATYKHGQHVLPWIIGNFGSEYKNEEIFEYDEHKYQTFVRNFNNDEVRKKLNTLNRIVNSSNEFEIHQALNFGYVVIFADDTIAKEVIEETIQLFLKAELNNANLKMVLEKAIINMTKHRFQDDITTTRRLIKMITQIITQEEINELPRFHGLEEYVKEGKEIIQKMQQEINELEYEKNQEITQITQQKNQEITAKNQKITQQDQKIKELTKKLKKYENEDTPS